MDLVLSIQPAEWKQKVSGRTPLRTLRCPFSQSKVTMHTMQHTQIQSDTHTQIECVKPCCLPNGLEVGRKCRAQRSVTVKAPERWLLTITCRGMDIAQTHTLHALSPHTPPMQMHPLVTLISSYEHTAWSFWSSVCVAVCMRACVCVFLWVSNTLVLHPGCYKLFSVPGAPLVVSDGFGPPCFPCLPVSIIGSLWCSGSCCLQLTYHRESKEIHNLGEGGENSSAQIKYLNLLRRIYLKPHLNKRLSRLLDRKLHQPLLLWDPEHEVWGKHLGIN